MDNFIEPYVFSISDLFNFFHIPGGILFVIVIWSIICAVQGFLAYGTAYRLTKRTGDNGIFLWLWFLFVNLATPIPGLGIYLWIKYRKQED